MVSDHEANSPVAPSEASDVTNSQASGTRARWWMLLPINLLKTGGEYLIGPMMTNVSVEMFNGNVQKAMQVTKVSESIRSALTILVTAQMGKISDSIGRKPLIALSIFNTLFPLALLTFELNNLAGISSLQFYIGAVVVGLLGGEVSPASQAYVADCTPETRARTANFSYLSASKIAMAIILPFVTTFLEHHYGRVVPFVIALVFISVALLAACLIPESLPREKRQPCVVNRRCSTLLQTFRQLFSRRGSFLWDFSVMQLLQKMEGGVPSMFIWKKLFDTTDDDIAMLTILSSASATFVLLVVVRPVLRCGCSPMSLVLFGIAVNLCFKVGYCLLALFRVKLVLFLLFALAPVARVYDPAFEALVTHGTQDDIGFVFGVLAAVSDIAALVSPLIMLAVYRLSPVAPFLLAALFHAVEFVYALKVRNRMRQDCTGNALVGDVSMQGVI